MADTGSASESDSSSIDGGPIMMPPSPVTREQLQKRIESLQQQNRVLKVEVETYKLKVKALEEQNRNLRQASVIIVSRPNSNPMTYSLSLLLSSLLGLKNVNMLLFPIYSSTINELFGPSPGYHRLNKSLSSSWHFT